MAEENREKIKVEVKTEEESEKETKSRNPWIYSTALLIVIVIAMSGIQMTGMFTAPDGATPEAQISPQDAGQKAVDFINNNLVQPGTIVALDSVTEMSGIYNVITLYMENEIPVYITKDGRYLVVPGMDVIDMDNFVKPETQEPEEPEPQPSETGIPKSDRPVFNAFVMSFCSYGQKGEEILAPVANLLGDKADIKLRFVVYEDYCGYGVNPSTCSQEDFDIYCIDEGHKYCGMHGYQEVNEDIRQACIQKYATNKLWDYVLAINSQCSSSNVDTCWEGIAKDLGINTEKIKTCQQQEGYSLLDIEKQAMVEFNARGSESFILNGQKLNSGNYRWSPENLKDLVCSAFNTQPSECSTTLSAGSGNPSGGGCG